MHKTTAVTDTLTWLQAQRFLNSPEFETAAGMFEPDFQFGGPLLLADSIHLHIRVDDVAALPREAFFERGAILENDRRGYVKFCFPGGVNAIFSNIPCAVTDWVESEERLLPRPRLDHLGIDLRRENDIVKHGFDHIPQRANALGWGHVPQGGKGRPVYCCHIQVAAKHWVYPPEAKKGLRIPLEFAFGPLKSNGSDAGCDLRPAAPGTVLDPTVIPANCC